MKKYKVYDRCGHLIHTFNNYTSAFEFLISKGRYDWKIKETIKK